MGWIHEDSPGHEGYVVGLVPEVRPGGYARWHELGYPGDEYPQPVRVRVIQIGCDCGWRSQRFVAPAGAEWHPFRVSLNDKVVEADAESLWLQHIHQASGRPHRLVPASWAPHQL